MYIALAILIVGVILVFIFVLGGLYTRHIILDSLDEARRQRMAEEYYRLAGVRSLADPKPYVPPTIRPRTPGVRMLPHMNTLDRLLHEGKRGTIMVRPSDWN